MRVADLSTWTLFACAMVLSVPGPARAQSQEEKRRQLQERLGIKPRPAQATPDAGVPVPETPSPADAAVKPAESPARKPAGANRPRVPGFAEDVRPILEKECGSCHGPEGMASRSRWVLRSEPADYEATLRFVQPAAAAQSPLLKKGLGTTIHGGKKVLAEESAAYATLLRWIEGGAPPGKARGGPPALTTASPGAPQPAHNSAPASAHPGATSAPGTSKPSGATPVTGASTPSGATSAPGMSASPGATPAPGMSASPGATSSLGTSTSSGATPAPGTPMHHGANPVPGASTSSGATPAPGTSTPSASPPAPAASASAGPPHGDTAVAPSFAPQVHEALLADCSSCHASDGMAGASRYVTHADPEQHLRSVEPLVAPGSAATSLLYQRAMGDSHPGGAVWEPGSAQLALLARWIDAGATGTSSPAIVATAPPAITAPGPAVAPPAPPSAPANPHGPAGPHGGVSLGTFPVVGSLSLNGRFDLNYERVNYNDHPFKSEGESALRSYHHFLFLTRQSAEDPVTLTLEVLSLQFWEVGYRINRASWPVKVFAKGGKVLVPFGGDPLFHHSYGGLAGFDQRVLPVVFAREGLTVNVERRLGPVALSGDAYVIAGYRLKRADAVLNLQSDLAPLEDTRLGVGARLGGAWGPINVWYSPYFNSLGFGRRLFLQALDVAVWRPRGLPVLEHFSLGAGLLRADVSGGEAEGYGGPGADYYHFASYLQLRYHPTDWLYVQYRQGLRTFGNRRGLILDSNALTREDASSHNVGVVARWRGLSAGLFQFWNLEKTDETPDDFTRLVVAYEF
ncbi:hypothetical protein [Corallococcus sp. AS-1-12]|uniref:hypothetical protein n=1 Tax=Corallococcus sp. AS-1-12 TaxID=2874598 RepID=UPI001CBABAED|nr:hypothetical protein [Corallococcus sp. AS-1-12]MBZ4334822.1 hypothetical protein [Corallococcus sp. AS-1-12]